MQQGGKSWWASPRMVGTVPSSSQEAPSGLGQPPEQAPQRPPLQATLEIAVRDTTHQDTGRSSLLPEARQDTAAA